jgi:nucleotide-binding universal stress UspA family protein
MFTRIVVAYDGTERAREALEAARILAAHEAARLVVLHALPKSTAEHDVEAPRALLHERVMQLRALGTVAKARVERGRPEDVIPQVAEQEQADLIFLAPRDRTLPQALRHPSVTGKLLVRTMTPLFIWPEHAEQAAVEQLLTLPTAFVIVPLDGSPEAECALELALAYARQAGRVLLLVHVLPTLTAPDGDPDEPMHARVQPAHEQDALRYLHGMRERMTRLHGCTVESMLLAGDPAEVLAGLAACHAGSLIVMTARDRGGLARLFLGSVATRLMHRAAVPLLVVPAAEFIQDGQLAGAQARARELVWQPTAAPAF